MTTKIILNSLINIVLFYEYKLRKIKENLLSINIDMCKNGCIFNVALITF